MTRPADEELRDGFTTNDERAGKACSECECGWYEPANGACLCGHGVAQHDEPGSEALWPRPWRPGLAGDNIVR